MKKVSGLSFSGFAYALYHMMYLLIPVFLLLIAACSTEFDYEDYDLNRQSLEIVRAIDRWVFNQEPNSKLVLFKSNLKYENGRVKRSGAIRAYLSGSILNDTGVDKLLSRIEIGFLHSFNHAFFYGISSQKDEFSIFVLDYEVNDRALDEEELSIVGQNFPKFSYERFKSSRDDCVHFKILESDYTSKILVLVPVDDVGFGIDERACIVSGIFNFLGAPYLRYAPIDAMFVRDDFSKPPEVRLNSDLFFLTFHLYAHLYNKELEEIGTEMEREKVLAIVAGLEERINREE